jgi:hypothetical protein
MSQASPSASPCTASIRTWGCQPPRRRLRARVTRPTTSLTTTRQRSSPSSWRRPRRPGAGAVVTCERRAEAKVRLGIAQCSRHVVECPREP